MAVRGFEDGPILWLGAAMHGQELSGIPIIWEIIKGRLDPKKLRGTVVGSPLQNPFSFNGRTYFTPQDGYNLNRVFPGQVDSLLTHRLAHLIFNEGILRSDYVIDFHCNMASAMCFSIIDEPQDQNTYRKYKEMARAFGITIIEAIPELEAHRTGLMSDEAALAGKLVLTVELVPWRLINPKAVQVGVRGTLNVMKSLGMIDGEIEPQSGLKIIGGDLSRMEINANHGGLVMEYADVGDEIHRNQVIGQIVDPYGDLLEDIISPIDGWLLAWPMIKNQAAGTGEHVAFIAFEKSN
jgi:predicted deacylase